jgi:hypothetical protein
MTAMFRSFHLDKQPAAKARTTFRAGPGRT